MIRIISKSILIFVCLFFLSCSSTTNSPGSFETEGALNEDPSSLVMGDPTAMTLMLALSLANWYNFSLNKQEKDQHISSIMFALNHSKNGELVTWQNSKRLSYGKVRVLRSKFNKQGKFCRIYDSYISLNGAERGSTNSACKNVNNEQWEFYK